MDETPRRQPVPAHACHEREPRRGQHSGHLLDTGAPRIEDPERLVQVFLQAVDRGELILFGRRVDRAMLMPRRVEYVYELSSRTTRAKIHARLKVPIPVPERKDCKVQSVTVVLDDGRIIETESHIWMEP